MARRTWWLVGVAVVLGACAKSSLPQDGDGGGGGGSGCVYGGVRYASGAHFKSSDGCNDCSCAASGNVACTARACVDAGPIMTLHWYKTCGAPLCGPSFDGPTGQPLCTTERVGAACSGQGSQCDPSLGCGVNLICAASDPTLNPGGCPISRARFKQDIHYLDQRELDDVAQRVLSMPLAHWRYRQDASGAEHMGFIIEDVEPSPSVDGDHVNLYGYASMAVAALQVQAQQIKALQHEVALLKKQLSARHRRPAAAP